MVIYQNKTRRGYQTARPPPEVICGQLEIAIICDDMAHPAACLAHQQRPRAWSWGELLAKRHVCDPRVLDNNGRIRMDRCRRGVTRRQSVPTTPGLPLLEITGLACVSTPWAHVGIRMGETGRMETS